MENNEQSKTTLEMINGLSEISDHMQDQELTMALTMIAKLIIKPDIAAKMAFRATWMTNVDKSDRGKKNIYYTAAESINDLVSALKYIMR
jgi:hypothetical protein